MPKIYSETLSGAGDMTWLASTHGITNARTETLNASTFTTVQTAKGKIPSGTPVVLNEGKLEPYTGTGTLAGHILTDQDASHGDVAVPVLDHGRVRVANVPAPSGTFKAPETQAATTIVYL